MVSKHGWTNCTGQLLIPTGFNTYGMAKAFNTYGMANAFNTWIGQCFLIAVVANAENTGGQKMGSGGQTMVAHHYAVISALATATKRTGRSYC